MSSLEKLEPHKNKLTILPQSIRNLKNLKELALLENLLTTLSDSITILNALRKLYLRINNFDVLLHSIGKLKNLEILSISDNSISELPESLYFSQKLRKIYIGNAQLKKESIFVDDFRSKVLSIYDY